VRVFLDGVECNQQHQNICGIDKNKVTGNEIIIVADKRIEEV
jgi:hypothetical protein